MEVRAQESEGASHDGPPMKKKVSIKEKVIQNPLVPLG